MNSDSKTIRKNFDAVIVAVIRTGLTLQDGFSLTAEEKEYYFQLAMYFDQSPESELDLKRGLLLHGTVGTGKTLAMKIMQRIYARPRVISSRHIIRDFLSAGNKGGDIINKYGRDSFVEAPVRGFDFKKPIEYCFDDLGLEEVNVQMYGNKANVMAEILLDRYEHFKTYGLRTHATTNDDADKLEAKYGLRNRDRMREMMNDIPVIGTSKRK